MAKYGYRDGFREELLEIKKQLGDLERSLLIASELADQLADSGGDDVGQVG